MKNKTTMPRPVVALSGGFDPPTAGHVAMIMDAKTIGDVIIILNSDEWCDDNRWSGRCFLPYATREKILRLIPGVVDVIPALDAGGTVCKNLEQLKPDFFGNGGERTITNTPEVEVCKQHHIGMLWFLGREHKDNHKEILKQATMEANRSVETN
jgi:cytidyltransferase-like protein